MDSQSRLDHIWGDITDSRLTVKDIPIGELKPNPKNPRIDLQKGTPMYDKLKASITEGGYVAPIIWNQRTGYIVSGHQRLAVMKDIAYENNEALDKVSCVIIDVDETQQNKLMIGLNKITGEWDDAKLNDLFKELQGDIDDLISTGFDMNEVEQIVNPKEKKQHRLLTSDFIVPPFSVLDARQGPWMNRKREWLGITGNLSETRNDGAGQFGTSDIMNSINEGTSNFDPVLAEVMYRWFNRPNGRILDPFGGEQTKGVVAGELGYRYDAVEIRQEQVDLNNSKVSRYDGVRYFCGDSNDISNIIKDRDYDMCFTSPPYYDLEVYSKEDMSALGTYGEFMAQYRHIFSQCYDMMADDTFLIIKVGEIRDKRTGIYRSFVPDNVRCFTDIGFHYYNELVLLNAIGTAPVRARVAMRNRKVIKLHQNVLVFYKGDVDNISKNYPIMGFGDNDVEDN